MFSFGPITARLRISCGEEFVIAFARAILTPTFGGSTTRVRLSNRFGAARGGQRQHQQHHDESP
jgi:hypothetical protein